MPVFLPPTRLLLHAVADFLWQRRRDDPAGVPSLEHLLVVMPTRQAARRLALELARKSPSGCLPPTFLTPREFLERPHPSAPADRVATQAEILALLAANLAPGASLDPRKFPNLFPVLPDETGFAWALGIARQLHELWRLLAENALSFADVASSPAIAADPAADRWRDLAALEKTFLAALEKHGLAHPTTARQAAVAKPAPPPDGITEIILPALADALPAFLSALEKIAARDNPPQITVLIHADPSEAPLFDQWGRPLPFDDAAFADPARALPLDDSQIILAPDPARQAAAAAAQVAALARQAAAPAHLALGNTDNAILNELASAFLARGVTLRNPAAAPLRSTPLGRLAAQASDLCLLSDQTPFPLVSAFLREGDVRDWLWEKHLRSLRDDKGAFSPERVLNELDRLQNERLPLTLAALRDAARTDAPALLAALDALRRQLADRAPHAERVRSLLREIFSSRKPDTANPSDRELAAAASSAAACLDELASSVLVKIPASESDRAALLQTLLDDATFQPGDAPDNDTLDVEGWLELPWVAEPAVVITGFNEGCVPASESGHPFLPDSLRQKLGLPSNPSRLARDWLLFRSILAPRQKQTHARVLLASVNAAGDILKPSRLLFAGCDDATLARRSLHFFQNPESAAPSSPCSLPENWRLNLPLPEETPFHKKPRVSVTSLNNYIASPLGFFLQNVLKMDRVSDNAAELDAAAFGTAAHAILEAFARQTAADKKLRAEKSIAAFLDGETDAWFARAFGSDLSAVLWLQREELKKRLAFFAARQSALFAGGWEIVASEQKFTLPTFEGVEITGKIDRVDRHKTSGAFRILDYKTWDKKKSSKEVFLTTGAAAIAAAEALNLPLVTVSRSKGVWSDLQLPLYRLAFKTGVIPGLPSSAAAAEPECLHLTIARSETGTGLADDYDQRAFASDAAAQTISAVLARLRAGIFWPPLELPEDFAPLFPGVSEKEIKTGISQTWLDDQHRRLKTLPRNPEATP